MCNLQIRIKPGQHYPKRHIEALLVLGPEPEIVRNALAGRSVSETVCINEMSLD
jgi:hypothetical protein